MKIRFATFLMLFCCLQTSLVAYNFEFNTSYDHFRGIADGSWNGDHGAFASGNLGNAFTDI